MQKARSLKLIKQRNIEKNKHEYEKDYETLEWYWI